MLIGEGTNVKYKPQSLAAGKDVMAHEYSHGIVQNQTKLIYDFGTIGTISEAYADIFACYADGNWKIGEDVVKKGCLRDVQFRKKVNVPQEYLLMINIMLMIQSLIMITVVFIKIPQLFPMWLTGWREIVIL